MEGAEFYSIKFRNALHFHLFAPACATGALFFPLKAVDLKCCMATTPSMEVKVVKIEEKLLPTAST